MTGTPIVQFGTSRFLQAHVDLFVSEALAAGAAAGPITVVQTSGAGDRGGRLKAFADPAGFPVVIRGLDGGAVVDRTVQVTSTRRGLSTAADWAEVTRIVVEEAAFLVSNTADNGYVVDAAETVALDAAATEAPASFPGKLLALLAARWRAGRPGLVVLPCELVNRNGATLRGIVLDLARRSAAEPALVDWIAGANVWADSLVDRIVSAPLEPAGAVAEPYALWAIERTDGLTLPCTHPAIALVDDLEPPERLKLHILNLGHTVLAERWRADRLPAETTVRGMLADAAVRTHLTSLYAEEVVPAFASHGLGAAAAAYVAVTLDRFQNPFLDHRVADIAQNHAAKIERRIGAFLAWSRDAGAPPQPRLAAIAAAVPAQ